MPKLNVSSVFGFWFPYTEKSLTRFHKWLTVSQNVILNDFAPGSVSFT